GAQQKTIKTSVLVIGGSTGGTAAAIQSARTGAKTILIESGNTLGGMLTAAGVSCTDGNDKLESGLWQEFREQLYRHYKTRNLFTGWVSETCFEPKVGDSIFKMMVRKENSLTLLLETSFVEVMKSKNRITGAMFRNKQNDLIRVNADITIDGTDLGDVFANAGAAYDLGMEDPVIAKETMAPGKFNIIQDLTWVAILKDYGPGSDKTISRPNGYDSTQYFCSCTDAPCLIGKPYIVNAQKMLAYGLLPHKKYMINWPAHGNDFIVNAVEITDIEREIFWNRAREKTLGFVYFIQTQLGFKHLGLADDEFNGTGLAFIPYHREGRRVRGIVRVDVNHLIAPFDQPEALYRTGISVGDYPVDHHHAPEKNAPHIDFPAVPSFNLPLGALIPKNTEGLLVAEKGISVSNIVNGSSRLQPIVMLTGQAAGALAAISVKHTIQPGQVNIREVQTVLLDAGAWLMPYCDVPATDPAWRAIQQVGLTGIMKGTGKPQGWENKTFFYPDSTMALSDLIKCFKDVRPEFKYATTDSIKKVTMKDLYDLLTAFGSFKKIKNEYTPATILARRQIAAIINQALNPFSWPVDWQGHL
ncbi:MAG: FAD-dependent oxidoreductase, partial [Chitinophagaceae bacterium]